MRRFSSALTRSADTGSPAGIPSSTATRPRPCDSPAVVNRKVTVLQASHSTRARPWVGLGAHHLAGGRAPTRAGTGAARTRGGAPAGPGGRAPPRRGGGLGDEGRQPDHHPPPRPDAKQQPPP